MAVNRSRPKRKLVCALVLPLVVKRIWNVLFKIRHHDFLTPHKAFIDQLSSSWNEEMRKNQKQKLQCAYAREDFLTSRRVCHKNSQNNTKWAK